MNRKEFIDKAKIEVPMGTVLQNPGRGTSTIIKYEGNKLCYMRGKSRFYIRLEEFAQAYQSLSNDYLTTKKLKDYKPEIFDSRRKGHDCNCTVLFMYLKEMGVVQEISGSGRSGSPFGVQLSGGA